MFLGASSAGLSQVRDIHCVAGRIIVLLHDLDHLVAAVVDFHEGEADIFFSKLAHLVLNFEAIRGSLRMVVTPVADVFTVTWSIGNVEGKLSAVRAPTKSKSFVESTLNIFGEVSTSCGVLLLDCGLD